MKNTHTKTERNPVFIFDDLVVFIKPSVWFEFQGIRKEFRVDVDTYYLEKNNCVSWNEVAIQNGIFSCTMRDGHGG